MAEPPGRRNPKVTHARLQRVERPTPHMFRIVLGGPGLATFEAGRYTDHYIKLLFPAGDVAYPEPFDLQRIRSELPRAQWPRMRTYTVRRWDPASRELFVDILYHGEDGIAGPWAARARPGDEVRFVGPGGGYAPEADADWHLLAGDESALPAIAAALERLPRGARAHAFIEVSGPEEEQAVETAGDVSVVWLHRGDGRVGDALVAAVRDLEFAPGGVQAFVHGEAGFVKELRRLLLAERGVQRERLSVSGYWRLGQDEDGWRATKREWLQEVEREEATA